MIRNLVWKEWLEHRWKLAYCSVILCAFQGIGQKSGIIDLYSILSMMIVLGSFVFPWFIGMGLTAPERADGRHRFLLSIPVSPRTIFAVKIGIGIVFVVIPFLLTFVLWCFYTMWHPLPLSGIAAMYSLASWLAGLMLIWTLAFSVTSSSEAKVGLIGMVVLFLWVMGMILYSAWLESKNPFWAFLSPLIVLNLFFHEYYTLSSLAFHLRLICVVGIHCCIAVLLWWWAGNRFAKTGKSS